MTTATKTSYYAIEWTHGRMTSRTGRRMGCYHAFDSAAARDAWVEKTAGQSFLDDGWRDPIDANDDELAGAIACEDVHEH